MVFLLPHSRIERSMVALAELVKVDDDSLSIKEQYIRALNTFQSVPYTYSDDIPLLFELDESVRNALHESQGVTDEELANENLVLNERQHAAVHLLVTRALERLESIDSGVYEYTKLLTCSIAFCNAKQGGGSLARNVGLVWFSPKKHWTVEYMAENLYHEALHQALFLEDMVRGIFVDEEVVMNEKYFVTSNFLDVKRPFDLALHGIFVSAELVHFYERHNGGERKAELVPKLLQSTKDMDAALARATKDGVRIFSDSGQELYDRMHAYIISLKD